MHNITLNEPGDALAASAGHAARFDRYASREQNFECGLRAFDVQCLLAPDKQDIEGVAVVLCYRHVGLACFVASRDINNRCNQDVSLGCLQ